MRGRRIQDILLPMLIVAIGVVLLLNTTGVLSWQAWSDLARLWPVAVILFGLSLVWRRLQDRL